MNKCSENNSKNFSIYKKAEIILIIILGNILYASIFLLAFGLVVWFVLSDTQGQIGPLIWFVFIPAALCFTMIRVAIFKLKIQPQGTNINLSDHQELKTLLESLSQQLNAPRIDKVCINADFNASASIMPSGKFWRRNQRILTLGLPLLCCLSTEDIKAITAHELAHHAKNHAKLNSWIYRKRFSWILFWQVLNQNRSTSLLILKPILNWYIKLLTNKSYSFSRQNEYEADALAARVVGASEYISSLCRYVVKRQWYKEYFKKIYGPSHITGGIPDIYKNMLEENKSQLSQDTLDKYLEESKHEEESLNIEYSTHPTLVQRAQALNVGLSISTDVMASALESFFVDDYTNIISEFDKEWVLKNEQSWQNRKKLYDKYLEYKNKTELNQNELIEFSDLTKEFCNIDDGLVILNKIITADDSAWKAHYRLAHYYISRNEEIGLKHVNKVLEYNVDDVESNIAVCLMAIRFYDAQKRTAESAIYKSKLKTFQRIIYCAKDERKICTIRDSFMPANASQELLHSILKLVQSVPGIKTAFLVRKKVSNLSQYPMYFLMLSGTSLGFLDKNELVTDIFKNLNRNEVIKIDAVRSVATWRLKRKVAKVDGALIYQNLMA